jgi:hypothetical protein
MGGINVSRWLLGGVVAAVVIWLIEGVASVFYMADMEAALDAHGLKMEMSASTWAMSVVVSLLVGLALVFFYAASRPRFGAGPRTAVIVAAALWAGATVVQIAGYQMLGIFPVSMLATWGVIGLVELILAALAGAWLYRE